MHQSLTNVNFKLIIKTKFLTAVYVKIYIVTGVNINNLIKTLKKLRLFFFYLNLHNISSTKICHKGNPTPCTHTFIYYVKTKKKTTVRD